MRHVIIGTAGHIDHGKTSLVKALTGIETDTLPEEQSRGVTIDIGFAYWKDNVTIIDVPGHERFVKNMVTGVCSVDLALFVVAADDGPMPQTREHLGILNLLGVERGVVALTKCDAVEPEWVELVTEELGELFAGTFLEDAPVAPVSSTTGEGIDALRDLIDSEIESLGSRSDRGVFRLPVDRAFSVRGFGTVVTGTVLSGQVAVKDELTVLPSGIDARVRGIQIHGNEVESAHVGARAAINLTGPEVEDLERGDLLVQPGHFDTTYMVDARLRVLTDAAAPVKNRTRVHLHVGPREVLARVIVLDGDEIAPGESGFCQLRLEEPGVAARGDRFVIRRYSPVTTLGGGEILDARPRKHRRNRAEVLDALRSLEAPDATEVLCAVLESAGFEPMSLERVATRLGSSREDAAERLSALVEAGRVVSLPGGQPVYLASAAWDGLCGGLVSTLEAFHAAEPMRPGIQRGELGSKVKGHPAAVALDRAVDALVGDGRIVASGPVLRLAEHKIQFSGAQEAIRSRIAEVLAAGGAAPPDLPELIALCESTQSAVREIVGAMQATGEVMRLEDTLIFSPNAIEDVRVRLVDFLKDRGQISVSEFRDLVGASRKYAVPLLNFFDNEGTTERRGDIRVLRPSADGAG